MGNTKSTRGTGSTKSTKSEESQYKPNEIEAKWQKVWEKQDIYKTPEVAKNKKYILDMFPYPSGASLHVGHVEGYVGTDVISRFERMKGNVVIHPMGWDAFGLPSENFAIKTGIHPDVSTHKNIETFKRQLNITGLSYDWSHEIDTSDPDFYRWTQWFFIQMFKGGLAYKAQADVNWCPSCETVLANEQVVDGKCERCGTEVVLKKLDQWFFKITEYADRLISGLDKIDWPEEVKIQQKNWIGRSEGAEIKFQVPVASGQITSQTGTRKLEPGNWIKVFTTRPDTLYGATFLAIAPDSPLVEKLTTKTQEKEVAQYLASQGEALEARKMVQVRSEAKNVEKTGVFTGSYAINPANSQKIPVWVTNYVVSGYGAEAVMGVPAHDERDFEFAKKYGLKIKNVIASEAKQSKKILKQVQDDECAYIGNGTLIDSGAWTGLKMPEKMDEVLKSLEKAGWGERKVTYHLRDWLISRQRYWGAPIPMIYCESCAKAKKGGREDMPGWYVVNDTDLPVLLPKDVDFKPTGESPITTSKTFQQGVACPNCQEPGRREVDTMDGYVDSSWYYIRFVDPKNQKEFASAEKIKKWLPVDVYVGGGHVVQHLLFARFFWKVLFDKGLIDKSLGDEPFLKLRAPGWILGPDSRKMSKRWSNVVTPDEIIPKYGADTLRMYEMFMGPFETMKPWNLNGVEGMSRFINKIWRLFEETYTIQEKKGDLETDVLINKLIKKVGKDIENMSFNTAISAMMITYNSLVDMKKAGTKINWQDQVWEKFLQVLSPFAPYITEELWLRLGNKDSIHLSKWPEFDSRLIQEQVIKIPVQINGKLRGIVEIEAENAGTQEVVESRARQEANVVGHLKGKSLKKVIFVPGKLINFVI